MLEHNELDLWRIVDKYTGRVYTDRVFLSREDAEAVITQWQNKFDRGWSVEVDELALYRMVPKIWRST